MQGFAGQLEPGIGDDPAAFGQIFQEALPRVGPQAQMAFIACCRKLMIYKEQVGFKRREQPADLLYLLKRQVDEDFVGDGF